MYVRVQQGSPQFSMTTAGGEQQGRPSVGRTSGWPKSTLKSFALALPEAEEPEAQLSGARSMKARSQRISTLATGLLKGLKARVLTSNSLAGIQSPNREICAVCMHGQDP